MGLIKKFCIDLKICIDHHFKKNEIKKRPDVNHGLWVGFLLPVCLILCTYQYTTSHIFQISCISSVALLLETILLIIIVIRKHVKVWPSVFIAGLFSSLLYFTILDYDIVFSLIGGFLPCLMFKYGLYTILQNCPLCFTFGEAILITQAVVLFVYSSTIHSFMSIYYTPISDNDIITNILELGVLAVIFIVITLFLMRDNMNLTKFYTVVISYMAIMIALLHITLRRSPILWMILYIFADLKRILMIIYWGAASGLGVIAIATQTSTGSKATTARRKIFHLLSVAVYLPGLIFEWNLIYLASGIALAGLIALETVRKLNLGKLSELLDDGFYVFADEKDIGGISLTPIYLLLGIALSLFICPTSGNENLLIALCGILSVGIGDTAASYFGSRYGRHNWPDCSKSIEGTMANVISQCLVIFLVSLSGFIKLDISSALICFIAILINSMVEAFTDQVDNLTLPLITFSILIFA